MNIVPPRRHPADGPEGASPEVDFDALEPSDEELAAIEREWPLIEAELAELDAWIQVLTAGRRVSKIDVRRLRRAERHVLAVRTRLADDAESGAPLPGSTDTEVA